MISIRTWRSFNTCLNVVYWMSWQKQVTQVKLHVKLAARISVKSPSPLYPDPNCQRSLTVTQLKRTSTAPSVGHQSRAASVPPKHPTKAYLSKLSVLFPLATKYRELKNWSLIHPNPWVCHPVLRDGCERVLFHLLRVPDIDQDLDDQRRQPWMRGAGDTCDGHFGWRTLSWMGSFVGECWRFQNLQLTWTAILRFYPPFSQTPPIGLFLSICDPVK